MRNAAARLARGLRELVAELRELVEEVTEWAVGRQVGHALSLSLSLFLIAVVTVIRIVGDIGEIDLDADDRGHHPRGEISEARLRRHLLVRFGADGLRRGHHKVGRQCGRGEKAEGHQAQDATAHFCACCHGSLLIPEQIMWMYR